MHGPIRFCDKCGHRCHCYSTNCPECRNDVCGHCDCKKSPTKYDDYHGGPYDRGSADSYYRRRPDPHYWTDGSYNGLRIDGEKLTKYQIKAYTAGYEDNENRGAYKDYG